MQMMKLGMDSEVRAAVQKVCRVSFDPDTRLTGQMSEECQKAGVPLDQEVSVRAIYHQSDRTVYAARHGNSAQG
jgi:hypothetical protein